MCRILVIDDEANVRYTVRQILECAGHAVFEAVDGAAGMRLFYQERPELVITDIFMPERDGLETIQMLKREFPAVKIIAISGGGRRGELMFLEMARMFGADRVLRKPFTRQTLLDMVQDVSAPTEFPESYRVNAGEVVM